MNWKEAMLDAYDEKTDWKTAMLKAYGRDTGSKKTNNRNTRTKTSVPKISNEEKQKKVNRVNSLTNNLKKINNDLDAYLGTSEGDIVVRTYDELIRDIKGGGEKAEVAQKKIDNAVKNGGTFGKYIELQNKRKTAEKKLINATKDLEKYEASSVDLESGTINTKEGKKKAKRKEKTYSVIQESRTQGAVANNGGALAKQPKTKELKKSVKGIEEAGDKRRLASETYNAYKYYDKHKDNKYSDGFLNFGDFIKGHYRLGDIGVEMNEAGNASMIAGDTDLEAVNVYQLLSNNLQENNKKALEANNKFTKSIASIAEYAPQMVKQELEANAIAIPLALVGSVAGSPVLGKKVYQYAHAYGSAQFMFRQTAGAEYINLIQNTDISVEDAQKLAKDSATSSAVVEFGLEMVANGIVSGGKKAVSKLASKADDAAKVAKGASAIGKTTKDAGKLAKGAKVLTEKAAKMSNRVDDLLVGKLGLSAATASKMKDVAITAAKRVFGSLGEGAEEYLQEGVSIYTQHLAEGDYENANAFNILMGSLAYDYTDEEKARMREAGFAGMVVGFGSVGIRAGVQNTITKTAQRVDTKKVGQRLIDTGESNTVIQRALLGDKNDKSYKMAQELATGKKEANAENVGKLSKLYALEYDYRNSSKEKSNVEEQKIGSVLRTEDGVAIRDRSYEAQNKALKPETFEALSELDTIDEMDSTKRNEVLKTVSDAVINQITENGEIQSGRNGATLLRDMNGTWTTLNRVLAENGGKKKASSKNFVDNFKKISEGVNARIDEKYVSDLAETFVNSTESDLEFGGNVINALTEYVMTGKTSEEAGAKYGFEELANNFKSVLVSSVQSLEKVRNDNNIRHGLVQSQLDFMEQGDFVSAFDENKIKVVKSKVDTEIKGGVSSLTVELAKAEQEEKIASDAEKINKSNPVDGIVRAKNISSAFDNAQKVVVGKDVVEIDNTLAVVKTSSIKSALDKAKVDTRIENPDLSAEKFKNQENTISIKGTPKVSTVVINEKKDGVATGNQRTIHTYVFEANGNYYSCKQKDLDAVNIKGYSIYANENPRKLWKVFNEHGRVVAYIAPTYDAEMTSEKFNGLQNAEQKENVFVRTGKKVSEAVTDKFKKGTDVVQLVSDDDGTSNEVRVFETTDGNYEVYGRKAVDIARALNVVDRLTHREIGGNETSVLNMNNWMLQKAKNELGEQYLFVDANSENDVANSAESDIIETETDNEGDVLDERQDESVYQDGERKNVESDSGTSDEIRGEQEQDIDTRRGSEDGSGERSLGGQNDGDVQGSGRGRQRIKYGDTQVEYDEVDSSKLTEFDSLLIKNIRKSGLTAIPASNIVLNGNRKANGVNTSDGKVIYDVSLPKVDKAQVVWHEVAHAKKRQNAKAFNEFARTLYNQFSEKELRSILKSYADDYTKVYGAENIEKMTTDEILASNAYEELVCDMAACTKSGIPIFKGKNTINIKEAASAFYNSKTTDGKSYFEPASKDVDSDAKFSTKKDNKRKKSKTKTRYDEYQTQVMLWANSTDRKPGDTTILYKNGQAVLLRVTGDGVIELAKGNYEEVKTQYERIHSEEGKSFYAYTQEIRSEPNGDMWDMQYAEDREYASRNGKQIRSERLSNDSSRNDEHLRSGDRGKSSENRISVTEEEIPPAFDEGKPESSKKSDVKASLVSPKTDSEYLELAKNPEQNEAKLRDMVDEAAKSNGYTVKAYHGTGRADRVGTVFRTDRATSGPMVFFTDSKKIASNYARDKADTSLAYDEEYDSYYTQFRVTRGGKSISIPELWKHLSISEKTKIKELAGQIKFDDDYENIIVDKSAKHGNGAYDAYTLNMHRGNVLETLVDTWLETGDLYNREADFLEVLRLVGIEDAEYRDPDARHEKVYDTWLKIQKPFDTEFADKTFYSSLSEWIKTHDMSVYEKETSNADMWDKNNQTPETWLEKLDNDIENGTTHAWTVIPDFVTDYLKEQKFDGIKDKGGKGGGEGHTVWVPFYSEQIKSADVVTYDDNGNVIPLSKRFNDKKTDIRFSLKTEEKNTSAKQIDKEYMKAVDSGDVETQEKMVAEAAKKSGFPTKLYHGTVHRGFTRVDVSKSDDGISFFATDSLNLAGTYSGVVNETPIKKGKRDTVAERENFDSSVKSFVDKVNSVAGEQLITAEDLKFEKYISKIKKGKMDFDQISQIVTDYAIDVVDKIRESKIVSKEDNSAIWDLSGYIEMALYGMSGRSSNYGLYANTDGFLEIDGKGAKWSSIPFDKIQSKTTANTREIVAWAKENGYTGVLFKNIDDPGGYGRLQKGLANVYAFLNPKSQIKSADPVTYDALGRVIPLSKRFNSEKGDLRFSLKDDGEWSFSDSYNELVEEYGAIPKGEKPARDVDVPRKISEDQVVSQFARTMMEAGVTPNYMLSEFEQSILDGTMTHEVITDKKAEAEAVATIKDIGFKEALRDWEGKTRNNSGTFSKWDIALGMELYNQCVNNKDVVNAKKIAVDLVAMETTAGQALQAARMLKKMNPDGQLYYIEKSVARLNKEFKNKLGKKFEDITLDDELMERFFTEENEVARNEIYDEICEDIAKQIPSTRFERWNSWRYLAMLGNPRTHIRNILGNAAFMPALRIKNYVAALGESMFVPQNERTRSVTKSESAIAFAKKDFLEMKKVLEGSGNKYEELGDIQNKRKIFKNDFFEKVRRKNFDFLTREDSWFLEKHYVDSLARIITARNLDVDNMDAKSLETARGIAFKDAQEATYRDANALATKLNQLKHSETKLGKAGAMFIEGVMPFTKTPLNIAKQGVLYSPVSILTGIYKLWKGRQNGDYTTAEVIDTLAKGFTGSALMGVGYMLSKMGLLSGAPEDEDQKKNAFDKMVGKQGYSICIDDWSYTIDWAAPSSMTLFTGTALYELTKNGKIRFKDVLEATGKISEPLLELSVMSGVSDAIDAAKYNESSAISAVLTNAMTNYFGQAFPTIGGQVSRLLDNKKRNYYYNDKNSEMPKTLQTLIGQASSKIPFAGTLFEPYIDNWGREETYGGVVERGLENFVSPGYYSEENYTKVDKELESLYEKTGENAVFPKTQQKYYKQDDVKYDMTASDYAEVKRVRGQKSFELVEKLISSKAYKSMSDEEKVGAIEKCYKEAGDYTKEKMFDRVVKNSKAGKEKKKKK